MRIDSTALEDGPRVTNPRAIDSIRDILYDEDYDFIATLDEAESDDESIADVRDDKYKYPRMNWQKDLEMLRRTKQFQSRYHMSEEAFNKLVELLRPKLSVNVKQSKRSTSGNDPITTEVIVGMGLRFLGGGLIKSTYWHYGLSKASAYRWIDKFLWAVDTTLDIKPPTPEECESLAQRWSMLSGAYDVYFGCVGAIDGWLCTTEKPRNVPAPTDYFSGHYQRYGLNIQAICGPDLQFLYFGVIGPGRMNDNRAFNRCHTLREWLTSLPDKYFLIGDNAYTLTRKMLIPHSGEAKQFEDNRTYNFFLSQLRMVMEDGGMRR